MALGKGPDWLTPATIDGLPAKNWTTREGVTMRGTFSQCVKRWLELHPDNRQNCSIGWGPNEDGHWGYFERPNIVGFLERNGPPSEMGGSVDKLPPTHADSDDLLPGHHAGGDGGVAAMEAWRKRKAEGKTV
jgi:hypothetical protein